MKKAIFLLIFAFISTLAFAKGTEPENKPNPSKKANELQANCENQRLSITGHQSVDAPCRYCSSCKGIVVCVTCSCNDCNAALEALAAALCAISKDCCYSVD
jgi:hypothetical protein